MSSEEQTDRFVRDAVARCYEQLAEGVLNLARGRGFTGEDPQLALAAIAAKGSNRLPRAILETWLLLRGRKGPFELREAVSAIDPDQQPDAELVEALLMDLRNTTRSERSTTVVDAMAKDGATAERLSAILGAALDELGEDTSGETAAPQLLARLVRRYREELTQLREREKASKDHHLRFLAALEDAAAGTTPRLDKLGEDGEVIAALAQVLSSQRLVTNRATEAEAARDEARREARELQQQLAEAQAEVERSAAEGGEDARLALYREAFALIEKGEDPQPALEAIREQERVWVVNQSTLDACLTVLDRALEAVTTQLHELRRISPIGPDPKRYRPRLLGASPYKLKSLAGMCAACRDATADVRRFLRRARRSEGLQRFSSGMKALRPALTEMVRLVADCRTEADQGITLSAAVNLQTTAGLASLPAMLGQDCHQLLASPAGRKMAGEVTALMDEVLAAYEALLAEVVDDLPASEVSKRKVRPAKALTQSADRLLTLARIQDETLEEVAGGGWEASDEDIALANDADLQQRALREVATMVATLADLPGSPSIDELPAASEWTNASSTERFNAAIALHHWLEEAARYRLQVVEG